MFAPGQTSKTVTVPIANDPNDEPNETFTFALANPDNALLGTPASTTVTISDNDAPPSVAWQSANFSDGHIDVEQGWQAAGRIDGHPASDGLPMEAEQLGHLLTGCGLVTGKQEESMEALALLAIGLLLEQGFQFNGALGDNRSLTMHTGLL